MLSRVILGWTLLAAITPGALAKSGRDARVREDGNFRCDVSGIHLTSWAARGMTLPQGLARKFKFWKAIVSQDSAPDGMCGAMTEPTYIIGPPGKGGVSRFDLVVAQEGVRVYRVFSKAPFHCGNVRPAAKLGAWWSFDIPRNKGRTRKRNAVCEEWNDLSLKVSCILKAGSVVAVGPTQSAMCRKEAVPGCPIRPSNWASEYPATDQHQLYLNLRGRSDQEVAQFLTNCRVTPWTDTE